MIRKTVNDFLTKCRLDIANLSRYYAGVQTPGVFNIPAGYNKVYEDFFQGDYKENWHTDMNWGQLYHPGVLYQWYDESQIIQTSSGLLMYAKRNPRTFTDENGNSFVIPNGIGIISSKSSWKYGVYIFEASFPTGKYLWPALWLSGAFKWPPEIDVAEAWSEDTIDYNKGRHITTNVHVNCPDNDSYGTYQHPLISPDLRPIKYTLWWEADFLNIYYNDYLVFRTTNKKILNNLNEAMKVIIGTGVQEAFTGPAIYPLHIYSLAIYQK